MIPLVMYQNNKSAMSHNWTGKMFANHIETEGKTSVNEQAGAFLGPQRFMAYDSHQSPYYWASRTD